MRGHRCAAGLPGGTRLHGGAHLQRRTGLRDQRIGAAVLAPDRAAARVSSFLLPRRAGRAVAGGTRQAGLRRSRVRGRRARGGVPWDLLGLPEPADLLRKAAERAGAAIGPADVQPPSRSPLWPSASPSFRAVDETQPGSARWAALRRDKPASSAEPVRPGETPSPLSGRRTVDAGKSERLRKQRPAGRGCTEPADAGASPADSGGAPPDRTHRRPAMTPERPAFFEGQILAAADLTSAVDYGRGQAARHERYLHDWGIAEGLELTTAPDSSGQVRRGHARARAWRSTAPDARSSCRHRSC